MSASSLDPVFHDEEEVDRVFRALADPTRRSILARLALRPATVSDIATPFEMSLPAVSKHLKVLENARLISRTIDGRVHRCSLESATLRAVDDWLEPYRSFWAGQFEALGRQVGTGRNAQPNHGPNRPR